MVTHNAHAASARRKGDRGRPVRGQFSDVRYLLVLVVPTLAIYGLLCRLEHLLLYVAVVYGLVLLLDLVVPAPRRREQGQSGASWFCSSILRLYVPVQLGLQLLAAQVVWQQGWGQVLPVAICVGAVCGGLGITVAHELGHSVHRFDRFLAWLLMGSVFYAQFMVEHYRGHHPRASTWRDPTTARFGESLWRFLPRCIAGVFVHAWKLEARRLYQNQRSWGYSPLVWAAQANGLFVLGTVVALAFPLLVFALLQAAVAIFLLEAVNYIGHYGLVRRQLDVRIEKFKLLHAWSANTWVSNTLLLNIQHHADHHVQPWKAFPALEAVANSPRLPTGYAGCIVLAAIPPLWFKVMNPRLERVLKAMLSDNFATRPSVIMDRR